MQAVSLAMPVDLLLVPNARLWLMEPNTIFKLESMPAQQPAVVKVNIIIRQLSSV